MATSNIMKLKTSKAVKRVASKLKELRKQLRKAQEAEKALNAKLTAFAVKDLRKIVKSTGVIPTSLQYETEDGGHITVAFDDAPLEVKTKSALQTLASVFGANFVKRNFVRRKRVKLKKGLTQADLLRLKKVLGSSFDDYFEEEVYWTSKQPLTKQTYLEAPLQKIPKLVKASSLKKPKVRAT